MRCHSFLDGRGKPAELEACGLSAQGEGLSTPATCLAWTVAIFGFAATAWGGTGFTAGGVPVRWADRHVRLEMPRQVHLVEGETGVHHAERASAVYTAVAEAARTWSAASGVNIELAFTDETGLADGANRITFTDPTPYLADGPCSGTGFIACTILRFDPDTGLILNASIAFNPSFQHSATGIPGTFDVGLVATHEIGHVLGLDHSAVLDSVMAPEVEIANVLERFPYRRLASDDLQTVRGIYPSETMVDAVLAGRVEMDGVAVQTAHVMALDDLGRVIHGALAGQDGAFRLLVPSGSYRILAEPLDGPVRGSEIVTGPGQGTQFATAFWRGADLKGAQAVGVGAGDVRADLVIEVQPHSGVNLETIGIVENGRYLGTSRAAVARGATHVLGATRSGEPANARLTPPPVAELSGGAILSAAAPQLIRQRIMVPADAAFGSYLVDYIADAGRAVLPGALRIAPAANAEAVRVDGDRVFITGADLGERPLEAATPEPELEWPTQLAGVSVRIGGRFAQLIAAGPEEIVALLPAGLVPGEEASVKVETGGAGPVKELTLLLQ